MYLNVSQLLKESPGAGRSFEIDDRLTLADQERESRVKGVAGLLRSPDGIWVSAILQTTVVCECSRCLRRTEQPIRLDIEEEFLPIVDVSTGAPVRYGEEEAESFYVDSNHVLDLREAVRQYAAMSLPMKPVCGERCAGLCPSCGVNRNETACACGRETGGGRWSPLLGLTASARKTPVQSPKT